MNLMHDRIALPAITLMRRFSNGARRLTLMMTIALLSNHFAHAAGPTIPWDFKPYKVKVWIVTDGYKPIDMEDLKRKLDESFYKSPGPAWDTLVEEPPAETRETIFRDFQSITYRNIVARDPVLAMKKKHRFASSVRSIATAGEKLTDIPGSKFSVDSLASASQTIPKRDWNQFLDSLTFDSQGKLLIAGGASDGGDAVISFSLIFAARLKNAIDDFAKNSISSSESSIKRLTAELEAANDQPPPVEGEDEDRLDPALIEKDLQNAKKRLEEALEWKAISDSLSLTSDDVLTYRISDDQTASIPFDFVLEPVRAATTSRQTWADFKQRWKLDDDDTLWLKLENPNLWMPLPDRVFKDFYLKTTRPDGIKSPDGAVGLDNRDNFVNQQVLIDAIRNLLISGDGWEAFAANLTVSEQGTLQMEAAWSEESSGAMIIPRGFAESLEPEAKIIDPKIPGSIEPMLSEADKVFLVRIKTETSPMQISVRELDCPMQLMGPMVHTTAAKQIDLADAVARGTLESFSPIVRLENVGQKIAKGQIRAGGLLMKDGPDGSLVVDTKSPAAINEGDWLRPVIRRVDRYGNPSMLEIVDFAFLKVLPPDSVTLMFRALTFQAIQDEVDFEDEDTLVKMAKNLKLRVSEGRVFIGEEVLKDLGKDKLEINRYVHHFANSENVRAVIDKRFDGTRLVSTKIQMQAHAGRIGTLQGRSDRRTLRIGMKIRPFLEQTVVRMHAQRQPDQPLIGYDIYEKSLNGGGMTLVGRSDWDGRIWLSKSEESPMRLLYVKNGRSVLARLPVVPGESVQEVADIPADDIRLRAEAYLKGVENAIVDLVAIRSLLAARIRLRLEKGKIESAEELFDKLRAEPTYDVISDAMDQTSLVIRSKNSMQQRTINNMFKRTGDLLREHISPVLISDLQRDITAVKNGEPMPSKAKEEEE